MTDIRIATFDQLHGKIEQLLKVIGGVRDFIWLVTYNYHADCINDIQPSSL